MNKILFILSGVLFSQINIAKTTIIAGHFDNPESRTVTLQYRNSIFAEVERTITKLEFTLEDSNTFTFEIDTDSPLNFHLLNGDKWLMMYKYAAVGDSIYFDFKEKETNMTSRCEACLAFGFEWEDKFINDPIRRDERNSSFTQLTPLEFSNYWNKSRRDQLQFMKEYFKTKNLPDDFKNYMESEINYDYAVNMLQYSWKNKTTKDVLKDSVYLNFLDPISLNNSSAVVSGRYLMFLKELPSNLYLTYSSNESPSSYFIKNQIRIRDSLAKIYFIGLPYDIALYQIFFERLKLLEQEKLNPSFPASYKKLDSLLFIYYSNFKDPSFAKRLKTKLESLNDAPIAAPNFTLKDLQGKEVRLSDFKGKVVYLDFWATTCGPCVAEIPHANELKKKFTDKDVVFLYVCLDHSFKKLKIFLTLKSFTGIHLIETKGTASKVAEQYEIYSFPHYFLIDRKGFIVNSDAPRPSRHPEELIEKLLLEK